MSQALVFVIIITLAASLIYTLTRTVAPPSVLVNGNPVHAIYVLTDQRQKKQWDCLLWDRSLVIVPGTERPLP